MAKGITATQPRNLTNLGTATPPTTPTASAPTEGSSLGAIGAASAGVSTPAPRISQANMPDTMTIDPDMTGEE
jgi:hypothetical protein